MAPLSCTHVLTTIAADLAVPIEAVVGGAEFFAERFGEAVDRIGRAVDLVERAQHVGFAHHGDRDRPAQRAGDLVVGEDIGRIAHADQEFGAAVFEHQAAVAACVAFGQEPTGGDVDAVVAQVEHRDAELATEELQQFVFLEEAELDQRETGPTAAATLLVERLRQLRLGDQPVLHQQIADAQAARSSQQPRAGGQRVRKGELERRAVGAGQRHAVGLDAQHGGHPRDARPRAPRAG